MSGRPAPRPKRDAEEFARSNRTEDNDHTKKPRFDTRNPSALAADAPEDDIVLEADEIGKKAGTKRNAVNIDGYESDSSNEGFDARAEAKAKASKENGSKDEDEGDMFADLEEDFADGDENEEKDGKKKKKVNFIDVDEIHNLGQEALQQDSSSDESDVADEVRAGLDGDIDQEVGAGGKKKHAPKIEGFNLDAETDTGKFDEHLNYVRKTTDPDAKHDSWLEGVSKKEMKKAQQAHAKRDQEKRQKEREEDAITTSEVLQKLIPHLEPTESVLEALARLGKGKEKKKPKWKTKNRNKQSYEMDIDAPKKEEEDPAETRRRESVEAITESADRLLSRGQTEIYEASREILIRQYQKETGEKWVEPAKKDFEGPREWEYRWSDARDGGDSHGPYDRATMVAWNNAGYFGEGVEFRVVGPEPGDWSSAIDF